MSQTGHDEPRSSRDLATRTDVHDLVVDFYREVVFDELLAPLFDEVAEVDWSMHMPKLVDYWCSILLGTNDRIGPVMAAHRRLHAESPICVEHCDRWYEIWTRALDARWAGPVADHARSHAASIMAGMAKHLFGIQWRAPDSTSALPAEDQTARTSAPGRGPA